MLDNRIFLHSLKWFFKLLTDRRINSRETGMNASIVTTCKTAIWSTVLIPLTFFSFTYSNAWLVWNWRTFFLFLENKWNQPNHWSLLHTIRVHPLPCKVVHFYVRKTPSQSEQTFNFYLLIWLAGSFTHVEMYDFTRHRVYP